MEGEIIMAAIKVVYWSGTGNTEQMAQLVLQGIQEAGGEGELIEVDSAKVDEVAADSVFALGCPAMGDEELEEGSMEPFVAELESKISGKKIGLFGSYSWAEGAWMESWVDRMKDAGAEIVCGEGIIAFEAPDDDAAALCIQLGKALVEAL